ncbi:MAG: YdcF family protein [Mesorhizobium sp.]
MFFIASKIFWTLAHPLSLSMILALASFLSGVAGWRRLAATAAGLGFLVLAISGWTTAGALMLHPLEDRFSRPAELPKRIDGIVVLGGGFEGGVNRVRGGYELNASGDRFVEAAALALRFPEAKVLVSGGAGALILEGEGDGETAPRLLEALGVDRARLLLDNEARNTEENAAFSKRMANPQEGETWLLVTSAFHMPRSVGLFRKAGFPVVPWPADYRTSGAERIGLAEDNIFDSTQNTALAIREWIGLVAYWKTGRIGEILPAPN